jgi:hypothetical protein
LTYKEKKYRYGVELIANHDFNLDLMSGILTDVGFRPHGFTTRLGLELGDALPSIEKRACLPTGRLNFRQPVPREYEAVLRLYLSGFGSPEENHPQAMINMIQLFGHPELVTWCAFDNDRPIGLGMLYLQEPHALLAAGVTAHGYQNVGIHESLIQLRVAHARSVGCTQVFAWCESQGQSCRNLVSQGFEVLRTERVWKLPSQRT